jgi:Chromatin associated protein KTI12
MVPYPSPLHAFHSPDNVLDSHSEKPARAALFAAMQRQMGRDTILIVDALNYIKGFRYQLYCAAREFKLRVCTVGGLVPLTDMSGTQVTYAVNLKVDLRCRYARAV